MGVEERGVPGVGVWALGVGSGCWSDMGTCAVILRRPGNALLVSIASCRVLLRQLQVRRASVSYL